MISDTNPEKLILKTKQYELADGLRDIQLGIYFLFFGLTLWGVFTPFWIQSIGTIKEKSGEFSVWLFVILWIAIPALSIIFGQVLIDYIRRRWLRKDKGEVKAKRNLIPWYVTLIGAVGFLMILFVGLFWLPDLETGEFYLFSLIMSAIGISTGLLMVGISRTLQIQRYVWMGVVGGLLSTFILFEQSRINLPPLYLGTVWGLVFIVGGGLALRNALLAEGK